MTDKSLDYMMRTNRNLGAFVRNTFARRLARLQGVAGPLNNIIDTTTARAWRTIRWSQMLNLSPQWSEEATYQAGLATFRQLYAVEIQPETVWNGGNTWDEQRLYTMLERLAPKLADLHQFTNGINYCKKLYELNMKGSGIWQDENLSIANRDLALKKIDVDLDDTYDGIRKYLEYDDMDDRTIDRSLVSIKPGAENIARCLLSDIDGYYNSAAASRGEYTAHNAIVFTRRH